MNSDVQPHTDPRPSKFFLDKKLLLLVALTWFCIGLGLSACNRGVGKPADWNSDSKRKLLCNSKSRFNVDAEIDTLNIKVRNTPELKVIRAFAASQKSTAKEETDDKYLLSVFADGMPIEMSVTDYNSTANQNLQLAIGYNCNDLTATASGPGIDGGFFGQIVDLSSSSITLRNSNKENTKVATLKIAREWADRKYETPNYTKVKQAFDDGLAVYKITLTTKSDNVTRAITYRVEYTTKADGPVKVEDSVIWSALKMIEKHGSSRSQLALLAGQGGANADGSAPSLSVSVNGKPAAVAVATDEHRIKALADKIALIRAKVQARASKTQTLGPILFSDLLALKEALPKATTQVIRGFRFEDYGLSSTEIAGRRVDPAKREKPNDKPEAKPAAAAPEVAPATGAVAATGAAPAVAPEVAPATGAVAATGAAPAVAPEAAPATGAVAATGAAPAAETEAVANGDSGGRIPDPANDI